MLCFNISLFQQTERVMIYTIYSISHPVTNVVFYVGKSEDYNNRVYYHLRRTSHNPRLEDLFKEIKALNLDPIFSIVEVIDTDKNGSLIAERKWIVHYNSISKLCNQMKKEPTSTTLSKSNIELDYATTKKQLSHLAIDADLPLQRFMEQQLTLMGVKGISYFDLLNKYEAVINELKELQKQ